MLSFFADGAVEGEGDADFVLLVDAGLAVLRAEDEPVEREAGREDEAALATMGTPIEHDWEN